MQFNITFKTIFEYIFKKVVLCIQIHFVGTEKTTRIASRASWLYTMYHLSNSIVRTVFNNALYNSNSCIGYKMAYFRNAYAIDITKHDPSFVFSCVKATGTYNNIAHSAAINNLLTLLHVLSDISHIDGFDGSEY